MAGAADALSGTGESSAAQRLSSSSKPTGKTGNPALTVKLRVKFDEWKAENIDDPVQWAEWLNRNGYGLGDNNHVYKLD